MILILSGSLYSLSANTQKIQTESENSKVTLVSYGKVLEKKEVLGYIYLKVDENGRQRWIAIARAPVEVGDTIGYDTKTVMKNFTSPTLGKTFEEIIFANEVYLSQKAGRPLSMKEMLSEKIDAVEVKSELKDFREKPFYTIEEVHRYRKELAGKVVAVKAKVYKVSHQIMRRDWVHLGDGTGNEQKLTDDLVFTASETLVKAGDHVIAKGRIVVDKDFGYGYFYKVIGENSTFEKQE